MIFLGEFAAGATVPYAVRYHSDQGTVEDPTSPTAKTRSPSGTWAAITAPAKQDSTTGLYGGAIDTTGYAEGLWLVSVEGTVSTAKTTGTVLSFRIRNNVPAVLGNVAHGGAAATLTLERAVITSTTTDEPAIKATGNGAGAGIHATGGNSGEGSGIKAQGGTAGYGIFAVGGSSAGEGIYALAGPASHGFLAIGGTTGAGIYAEGGPTNGSGFVAQGNGTGADIDGDITGNLSGSVGSVTGAVGSVASPVTAGTVSDKTGYSLAADQSGVTIGTVNAIPSTQADAEAAIAAQLQTIVDGVLDESLTTHNVPNSAGRRLRQIAEDVIVSGMVVSATANTITLGAEASSADGAYDPANIFMITGTGAGQTRLILEYDGATKTAVVDRDWKVTPDATTEYVIAADAGRESVNEGRARGGGASTITLNPWASSDNDTYLEQIVFLRSGTGQDQARRITGYDGTTKIATVGTSWITQPDTTTGYVILPTGTFDVATTLLQMAYEGSETFQEFLKLARAALVGKASGGGTSTINFRDAADTKNRISASVDSNGNRTSVVTDGS